MGDEKIPPVEGRKDVLFELLSERAKETTMHGPGRAASQVKVFRKIIWILLILGAFGEK